MPTRKFSVGLISNSDRQCVRDRRNKFHEKLHGSFANRQSKCRYPDTEKSRRAKKGGRKDRLCIAALC
jgi:hypothetical protein